jgi:hypothetical protein
VHLTLPQETNRGSPLAGPGYRPCQCLPHLRHAPHISDRPRHRPARPRGSRDSRRQGRPPPCTRRSSFEGPASGGAWADSKTEDREEWAKTTRWAVHLSPSAGSTASMAMHAFAEEGAGTPQDRISDSGIDIIPAAAPLAPNPACGPGQPAGLRPRGLSPVRSAPAAQLGI